MTDATNVSLLFQSLPGINQCGSLDNQSWPVPVGFSAVRLL